MVILTRHRGEYAPGVISSAAMRAPVMLFLVLVSVTSGMLAAGARAQRGARRVRAHVRAVSRRRWPGGEMGPGITTRITLKTDQELTTLVRAGLPAKGMPGFRFTDAELRQLVAFVRTLAAAPRRGAGTRQRQHLR